MGALKLGYFRRVLLSGDVKIVVSHVCTSCGFEVTLARSSFSEVVLGSKVKCPEDYAMGKSVRVRFHG